MQANVTFVTLPLVT